MNATITRKSKIGFGYTSAVENDDFGNLRVCSTTRPDHVGTILQVNKSIQSDRTLASFQGGTYYSTAWFVKLNGKWNRIVNSDDTDYELDKLSEKQPNMYGEMVYCADAVTVEIEES
jgi:hypothetical protein